MAHFKCLEHWHVDQRSGKCDVSFIRKDPSVRMSSLFDLPKNRFLELDHCIAQEPILYYILYCKVFENLGNLPIKF